MKNILKDPLIFIINLKELEFDKRIDVHYYKPEYLQNLKFLRKSFSLDSIENMSVLVKDGPHQTPSFVEVGIPFLQKGDVTIGNINYDRSKHVSVEFHEENKKTQTIKGDILIRKIGVGPREAAVVDQDRPLHIYVSIALIRLLPQYSPYFVEMFLNSKFGLLQTERRNKGIGTPDLHLEDIKTIEIPHISEKLETKIVKEILNARKKNNKILEEISLIRTKFFSDMQVRLGLTEIDESADLIFSKQLPSDRLDVRHHSPIYEKLETNLHEGKFDVVTLQQKSKFPTDKINPKSIFLKNYFKYIQLQDIDTETNEVISFSSISGEDSPSRAKLMLQTNDLLIPTLGGSLNSIFQVSKKYNGTVGSTGFIKLDISDQYWREFIKLFLISKYGQYQLIKYLTGSIMPSINKNNLKKILIPNPDPVILKKIVNEYKKFEKESISLRKKYVINLQKSLNFLETSLTTL
ncbi:hypothetical protein [Nitrosopumilus sp.]|uniref:hypothetical protein n=1 Tax=Nitrosopumilus sp. TaxID=2024843 RepID=UPI0034A01DEC